MVWKVTCSHTTTNPIYALHEDRLQLSLPVRNSGTWSQLHTFCYMWEPDRSPISFIVPYIWNAREVGVYEVTLLQGRHC